MSEEQTQVRKQNHLLRTFTGVMMLFIAVAHYFSRFEMEGVVVNDFLYSAGRFVIPVFAMISGYFCFSKDGHSERGLKRKAVHILVLIVVYKLFYLVFTGIFCMAGVVSPEYLLTEFLVVSPEFSMDCYGGTVALRTTQPIWFVYSLLLIYEFWLLLYNRRIDFKWAWLLAAPVLVASLLLSEFLPMMGVYEIGGNSISGIAGNLYPFITLPFFVMGYSMHRHKERIDSIFSNACITALFVLGFALIFLEVYLVPDCAIIYTGSLIVAFSVMVGSFRVPEDKARFRVFEFMGQHLLPWMYVSFAAAAFLMRYVMQSYSHSYVICEIIGPVLAVLLDIAMAYAMYSVLKRADGRKANVTE